MNDFLKSLLESAPSSDPTSNLLRLFSQSQPPPPPEPASYQPDPEFANAIQSPPPLHPITTGTMLDSMVSPPGIQAPLYNYGQSPQENASMGSAMGGSFTPPAPPNLEQPQELAPIAPVASMRPAAKMSATPPAPEQAGISPVPQQSTPPQQDPLAALKMLQDERRKATANIDMADAASQIGTAIAGGGRLDYKPGQFDALKNAAGSKVADYFEQQKASKEILDLQMAKQQATDKAAQSDPNSAISRVARASAVTSLRKIGRTKDADNIESSNLSSNQVHDLFGTENLSNMYSNYEAQQNRLEMAKMRSAQAGEIRHEKMDAQDMKRLDAANKMVTASINRSNTAFGKMAQVIRSADAIKLLAHDTYNLDNRQIKELAASLDSMLTSGASTVSGRAGLVPHTYSGDAAKITEYITNMPKGANQAAFVKRALETVEREKRLAESQIAKEAKKMLSSYADLQEKQPEAWNTIFAAHDLDPNVFKNVGSKDKEEPNPKKIHVTNGSEVREIDSSDLQHAIADGYRKVNE